MKEQKTGMIDNLLLQLGQSLSLGQLMLNDENVARLVFDDNITVDFEGDPDGGILWLITPLCPIPTKEREGIFMRYLENNLTHRSPSGAAIAIDKQMNEVVLMAALHAEKANLHDLQEILGDFVNRAEQLIMEAGQSVLQKRPQVTEEKGASLRV